MGSLPLQMLTFGMRLEVVLPVYKDHENDLLHISFDAPDLPNMYFRTVYFREHEGYKMFKLVSDVIDPNNAEVGLYPVTCTWTDMNTGQSVSEILLLDIMPTWEYAAGVREGWIKEVTLD